MVDQFGLVTVVFQISFEGQIDVYVCIQLEYLQLEMNHDERQEINISLGQSGPPELGYQPGLAHQPSISRFHNRNCLFVSRLIAHHPLMERKAAQGSARLAVGRQKVLGRANILKKRRYEDWKTPIVVKPVVQCYPIRHQGYTFLFTSVSASLSPDRHSSELNDVAATP